MSSSCTDFVQNAWRKDLCANCMKSKSEHVEGQGQGENQTKAVPVKKVRKSLLNTQKQQEHDSLQNGASKSESSHGGAEGRKSPQGVLKQNGKSAKKPVNVKFGAREKEIIGEDGGLEVFLEDGKEKEGNEEYDLDDIEDILYGATVLDDNDLVVAKTTVQNTKYNADVKNLLDSQRGKSSKSATEEGQMYKGGRVIPKSSSKNPIGQKSPPPKASVKPFLMDIPIDDEGEKMDQGDDDDFARKARFLKYEPIYQEIGDMDAMFSGLDGIGSKFEWEADHEAEDSGKGAADGDKDGGCKDDESEAFYYEYDVASRLLRKDKQLAAAKDAKKRTGSDGDSDTQTQPLPFKVMDVSQNIPQDASPKFSRGQALKTRDGKLLDVRKSELARSPSDASSASSSSSRSSGQFGDDKSPMTGRKPGTESGSQGQSSFLHTIGVKLITANPRDLKAVHSGLHSGEDANQGAREDNFHSLPRKLKSHESSEGSDGLSEDGVDGLDGAFVRAGSGRSSVGSSVAFESRMASIAHSLDLTKTKGKKSGPQAPKEKPPRDPKEVKEAITRQAKGMSLPMPEANTPPGVRKKTSSLPVTTRAKSPTPLAEGDAPSDEKSRKSRKGSRSLFKKLFKVGNKESAAHSGGGGTEDLSRADDEEENSIKEEPSETTEDYDSDSSEDVSAHFPEEETDIEKKVTDFLGTEIKFSMGDDGIFDNEADNKEGTNRKSSPLRSPTLLSDSRDTVSNSSPEKSPIAGRGGRSYFDDGTDHEREPLKSPTGKGALFTKELESRLSRPEGTRMLSKKLPPPPAPPPAPPSAAPRKPSPEKKTIKKGDSDADGDTDDVHITVLKKIRPVSTMAVKTPFAQVLDEGMNGGAQDGKPRIEVKPKNIPPPAKPETVAKVLPMAAATPQPIRKDGDQPPELPRNPPQRQESFSRGTLKKPRARPPPPPVNRTKSFIEGASQGDALPGLGLDKAGRLPTQPPRIEGRPPIKVSEDDSGSRRKNQHFSRNSDRRKTVTEGIRLDIQLTEPVLFDLQSRELPDPHAAAGKPVASSDGGQVPEDIYEVISSPSEPAVPFHKRPFGGRKSLPHLGGKSGQGNILSVGRLPADDYLVPVKLAMESAANSPNSARVTGVQQARENIEIDHVNGVRSLQRPTPRGRVSIHGNRPRAAEPYVLMYMMSGNKTPKDPPPTTAAESMQKMASTNLDTLNQITRNFEKLHVGGAFPWGSALKWQDFELCEQVKVDAGKDLVFYKSNYREAPNGSGACFLMISKKPVVEEAFRIMHISILQIYGHFEEKLCASVFSQSNGANAARSGGMIKSYILVIRYETLESLEDYTKQMHDLKECDLPLYEKNACYVFSQVLNGILYLEEKGFVIDNFSSRNVLLVTHHNSDERHIVVNHSRFLSQVKVGAKVKGHEVIRILLDLLQVKDEDEVLDMYSRGLQKIIQFLHDEENGLLKVKNALEFMLWGPQDEEIKCLTLAEDREQAFNIWLDVERNAMVNKYAAMTMQQELPISIEEMSQVRFLCRASGSRLFENTKLLYK